jgi:hypothetical protein
MLMASAASAAIARVILSFKGSSCGLTLFPQTHPVALAPEGGLLVTTQAAPKTVAYHV